MRITLAAFIALCSLRAAAAQVFIVDAAGGAGAHFTDLAAAVAAVPDGATLRVRAGAYPQLVIDGKGLEVVGEGGVAIGDVFGQPPQSIEVRNTTATQTVLIRGVATQISFSGSPTEIVVANAMGPVILEGIVGDSTTNLVVERSRNVQVHACALPNGSAGEVACYFPTAPRVSVTDSVVQLSGSRMVARARSRPTMVCGSGDPGLPGLSATRSRVILVQCHVEGSRGSPGCNYQRPTGCGVANAGHGGVGMVAVASTVIAMASTVVGAAGHSAWTDISGPVAASNGGDSIRAAAAATVKALGTTLSPGAGGGGGGVNGRPLSVDATSNGVVRPGARPTYAEIRGNQARGNRIDFTARGAPASPVVMLLSYSANLTPAEPLSDGSVLATPAAALGAFTIAANGEFVAPFSLPATWPLGEVHAVQFVALEPGPNTIWLSNAVMLHVNH